MYNIVGVIYFCNEKDMYVCTFNIKRAILDTGVNFQLATPVAGGLDYSIPPCWTINIIM